MATSYTAQTIPATGDVDGLSTAVKTLVKAIRDGCEPGMRLSPAEIVTICNVIIDTSRGNSTLTMP